MRNFLLGAFGILAVAVIAACGGGSPSANYPAPLVGSGSTTAGIAIALPQASGLAVGAVTVAGTGSVSAQQGTSNPSAVSVLSIKHRNIVPTGQTAVAYVTITATSAVTISGVTVAVAPQPPVTGGTYSLAYWNGSQWVSYLNAAGTAPVTATPAPSGVITVSSGNINPVITLAQGASLYLAVYTGGGTFSTPTPNPAAPQVTPSALTLSEGQQDPLTVTSGGNITITATSSNTAVATVTASATTGPGATSTATFTVTAGVGPASIGTATITFKDPLGQTTTAAVTVNNTAPTPVPAPTSATVGLGDVVPIVVTAHISTQITITSSSTAVAELNTTDSSSGASGSIAVTTGAAGTPSAGQATFYVYGVAGGTATISMTDTYGNTGTLPITISAIANGNFTQGRTGWTPCTYSHTSQATGTNATQIIESGTPSYATVQGPQIGATAVPVLTMSPAPTSTPLSNLVTPIALPNVPNNDNPGYPSAGSIEIQLAGVASGAPSTYTIKTPGTPPPFLGNDVMLLGSLNGSTNPNPAGTFGMCQTITIPASAPYLSLYVLEGGEYYKSIENDQEVAVFPTSTLTSGYIATGAPTYLFLEWNCYLDPSYLGWGTGESASNSCLNTDTTAGSNWYLGGAWEPRGPYNLSSFAGEQVTLFIGVWAYYSNYGASDAKYNEFMYVGNVQMTANGTSIPSSGPMTRTRPITYALPTTRGSVQTIKRSP
jgi:hypothetical protein